MPSESMSPQELLQAQTAIDQIKALSCDFGRMVGQVYSAAVSEGASDKSAERAAEIWAEGFARMAFPRAPLFGSLPNG
jgi:hypothetical protein